MTILFFLNNVLLGFGLSMDAFSVSLANGLNEPHMRLKKILGIAGTFGIFQGIMPMTGWFCVHTIVTYFRMFETFIPWIALILLSYIGIHMIIESRHPDQEATLSKNALFMQGVATSIDALSVGFTIADYDFSVALLSATIVAITTFIICFTGVILGRKAGTKLSSRASVVGGVILILIGLEIFIKAFI